MRNVPASEPLPWSPLRWTMAIVFVLAVEIILMWQLSIRLPIPVREAPVAAFQRLLAAGQPGPPWVQFLGDPALFVSIDRQGFSGLAWLNAAPLQHPLADWTNRVYWLAPAVSQLGNGFSRFIKTNQFAPVTIVEDFAPQPTRLFAAGSLILTQSTMRVEGGLAQRALVALPALPAVASSEILSNTVVHALVNAPGYVLTATVLGTSGLAKADRLAQQIAKGIRFQAVGPPGGGSTPRGTGTTPGILIFQWYTIPETNSAGDKPVP
jgi:hypothetical protein